MKVSIGAGSQPPITLTRRSPDQAVSSLLLSVSGHCSMTRIPFVEAKLFPVGDSEADLEYRFENHLRKLREDKHSGEELSDEDDWHRSRDMVTSRDRARIRRWAVRIIKGREKVSGIMHLRPEDRKSIEILNTGVQVGEIDSEARADEIAAALHAEMPWMAPATELFWQAMRQSVRSGMAGFRLPPLLLNGPPGIGKSVWGPQGERSASGSAADNRCGWRTGFLRCRGFPAAVGDRRIRASRSRRSSSTRLPIRSSLSMRSRRRALQSRQTGLAAVCPMHCFHCWKPATAARWECPFYQLRFDMSWIGWILTSNSLGGIPEPLQTRLNVVNLNRP